MSKELGHRPDPTTDCPFGDAPNVERPSGDKLLSDALAMGKGPQPYRCTPLARATAVTISGIQINRVGPDGLPALPTQLPQGQTVSLTHIDPEGRGRSIGRQLDDLLARAEEQSLEEWKEK